MVIVLTFEIRECSRPNGNMPLFLGRLLNNQDVPDIKRKHSPPPPNKVSPLDSAQMSKRQCYGKTESL
jgi:hypothetical protein